MKRGSIVPAQSVRLRLTICIHNGLSAKGRVNYPCVSLFQLPLLFVEHSVLRGRPQGNSVKQLRPLRLFAFVCFLSPDSSALHTLSHTHTYRLTGNRNVEKFLLFLSLCFSGAVAATRL